MTDGDKKVFKLYFVGAFGTDVAQGMYFSTSSLFLPDLLLHKKNKLKKTFIFLAHRTPVGYTGHIFKPSS